MADHESPVSTVEALEIRIANPRYPLISEIRELYLDAYFGREATSYED